MTVRTPAPFLLIPPPEVPLPELLPLLMIRPEKVTVADVVTLKMP